MSKSVELILSLCQRWGYGGKIAGIQRHLIRPLEEKYDVNVIEEPIVPGMGEYLIFLKKGNEKKIIFSNMDNIKDENTIMGQSISGSNAQTVIAKIESLI